MEKAEVLEILNDWNFWKKNLETGIKRKEATKRIKELSKTKEITVIKGVRRSGKSTALLQFCSELIEEGIKKENILIINFEDPRFIELNLKVLNQIYEIYLTELKPDGEQYIVLDEVQVIDGWEKFARFLHENKKANVFVTGSSSKLLSSEYSTVLAGRHLDVEITPLSFREYLAFKNIEIKNNLDVINKRHAIKSEFDRYLLNGGFPKVALTSESRSLLETYFNDIIIKDIVKRFMIKDVNKLEELAKYYLSNVSTMQSFNSLKNILNLNLDTVERFSRYLCDAFILSFVKKFSYSEKEQLLNPRKVYCADNGLRNAVAFVFSNDYGRLAENIVFGHLRKYGGEIYYWKSKDQKEVDFIVRKNKKTINAIQVCWNIEKAKKREIDSLIEACKELKLKEGIVLTQDTEKEEKVNGVKIITKPIWKWALEG